MYLIADIRRVSERAGNQMKRTTMMRLLLLFAGLIGVALTDPHRPRLPSRRNRRKTVRDVAAGVLATQKHPMKMPLRTESAMLQPGGITYERCIRCVAVIVFVSVAGAIEVLGQHSPLVDAVSRSGFIFVGTVKAIGVATPTIAKTPNSAVVTVNRVIEALPPIGDPTGKDVTVRLLDTHKLRQGQRAVFFTYLQTAGATLGLVEVASESETQESRTESQIKAARQTLADGALSHRLASARSVVVGTFGEAKPTEEARERNGEHDPMWWSGPIDVQSFEKGQTIEGPVYVNYASSDDVVWERSPKPKAGQRGIFLLQAQIGKPIEKRYEITGRFLIDPLDLQPVSELERVRRLLKTTRR
jgi:hypothetical protein